MADTFRDSNIHLSIDRAEIADILAPFVMEEVPVSNPRWLARMEHFGKRWHTRAWKRRVLGWIPGIVRTQTYVRSSYEETWSARPWPVTHTDVPDPKPSFAHWEDRGLTLRRGVLRGCICKSWRRSSPAFAPGACSRWVLDPG